ncbi:VTT domain-containing protein [Shouchella sp. 1P09AA]|uniref:TVP38/TMEM64 family protein n=1 Tax=unclassified Shouchella TaxID=2893065 RepID=UPI00399FB018
MEGLLNDTLAYIEAAGWYAPMLFIILHIIRPILFLPVLLVTLAGGYVFGMFYGMIFSYVGLMGVSLTFYWLIERFPSIYEKLKGIKEKLFGSRGNVNIWQLLLLRIMPFVHFHALSFYVMEESKNYRDYVKTSAIINISPAVVYTAFGGLIHQLPLPGVVAFALFLLLFMFILRPKKHGDPIHTDDLETPIPQK